MPSFQLSAHLLSWYDTQGRVLPWRKSQKSAQRTYEIWLSEIMLQQTGVQTVIPYFLRFLRHFPTLKRLAKAPIQDILSLWQGLGYYHRAHNLHKCAQIVATVFHGEFPQDRKTLLSLPGIGPYTASAIQAIAFDQPVLAVDGNIARIFARYDTVYATGDTLKRAIAQQAVSYLPTKRAGDYNQALMDLGSLICVPRHPLCAQCPIQLGCKARASGTVSELPVTLKRQPLPHRYGHLLWIQRQDGCVLAYPERTKKLLHGLFTFPSTPWTHAPEPPDFLGSHMWAQAPHGICHTFTHFKLHLTIWQWKGHEDIMQALMQDTHLKQLLNSTEHSEGSETLSWAEHFPEKIDWIHPKDFTSYPFSTLMKKVIQYSQAEGISNSLL